MDETLEKSGEFDLQLIFCQVMNVLSKDLKPMPLALPFLDLQYRSA